MSLVKISPQGLVASQAIQKVDWCRHGMAAMEWAAMEWTQTTGGLGGVA